MSVSASWSVAFDRLADDGPAALDLLTLMAWLDPELPGHELGQRVKFLGESRLRRLAPSPARHTMAAGEADN